MYEGAGLDMILLNLVWESRRKSIIDIDLLKTTPTSADFNLDCFVEVRIAGRGSEFDLAC